MRKVYYVCSVAALCLGLGLAVGGCGTSTSNPGTDKMHTEKMGSDKMGGDKMHTEKMGSDKMGADKMHSDKMGSDKMKDDGK